MPALFFGAQAMNDLWAALCLVAVIEGLILFALPNAWRQMVVQMLRMPTPLLRRYGATAIALGLTMLWWLRH
jgi:uncharacterized protein